MNSQCDRLIAYMREYGRISTYAAFKKLGITRLSGRIYDLKKRGYEIESVLEQGKDRYGNEVRWKVYRLSEKEKCTQNTK